MIFITFLMLLIWAGILGTAYINLVLFLCLAYYVLYAYGAYKMFTKAGVTGWYAFIPFVNEYELYKLAWGTTPFFIYFIAGFAGSYLGDNHKGLSTSLSFVTFALDLVMTNKLAKAYGKGTGFGLGLFFFKPIFIILLGVGNDQYLGPQA